MHYTKRDTHSYTLSVQGLGIIFKEHYSGY